MYFIFWLLESDLLREIIFNIQEIYSETNFILMDYIYGFFLNKQSSTLIDYFIILQTLS